MSIRQASDLTRILQKVTAPLRPSYSPIVDDYRYQYPIDWDVMWNAGARIVFLRCTVGNYYTDTAFAEFWKGAKARGFLVGVYHVNTPEYSYQSQMGRLFGSLGLDGRRPDFPIVLDCELTRNQSPAAISNNILGCLQTIEDEDGRLPFIYTSTRWHTPSGRNMVYLLPTTHSGPVRLCRVIGPPGCSGSIARTGICRDLIMGPVHPA